VNGAELSMGRVDPRVGSGRVGSRFLLIPMGRVGSKILTLRILSCKRFLYSSWSDVDVMSG
jgi:hypothetical protein